MKIVTIHCEHATPDIRLRISGKNIWCIQCGLIQIVLSHKQAARVRRHCDCMPNKLEFEHPNSQGRAYMTVDPTQVDLGGEITGSWLIG
jgi:hypothetical protein